MAAPVNTTPPTVTGPPHSGGFQTCCEGVWTGSLLGYLYQWKIAGVIIDGETRNQYAPKVGDVGSPLTCRLTAISTTGEQATLETAGVTVTASAPLAPIPSFVSSPVLGGASPAHLGDTLTVTNTGTWTNSPTYFYYQWRRDGVNIGCAIGSSYVVKTADLGKSIDCVVWGANASGIAVGAGQSNGIAALSTTPNKSYSFTDGVVQKNLDSFLWNDRIITRRYQPVPYPWDRPADLVGDNVGQLWPKT